MILWRWLFAFSCIALSLTSCDFRKKPQDVAKQTDKSIVFINYEDQSGNGTGFFVQSEKKEICTIITARHVALSNAKLQLQTHDQKIWKIKDKDIKRFLKQDLAIVTFKAEGETCPYKALNLGDSAKAKEGDIIYIKGFSGTGSEKQFIIGSVSSINNNRINGYGISYNATTVGGMSGSPVINRAGEVIAVHGRTDQELTKQAAIKNEVPITQQESTSTKSSNSQANDTVGISTFKWGIPINIYKANITNVATEIKGTQKAEDLVNQGNDLSVSQDYKQAIDAYQKALKVEPDHALAWYNQGNVLRELKRYPEAEEAYDKAIKIKPGYYEAWYGRGIALRELKRYSDAKKSYDKAIGFKPDYYEAWNSRGVALFYLKDYKEALESYNKAISIKPDFKFALTNREQLKPYLKRSN